MSIMIIVRVVSLRNSRTGGRTRTSNCTNGGAWKQFSDPAPRPGTAHGRATNAGRSSDRRDSARGGVPGAGAVVVAAAGGAGDAGAAEEKTEFNVVLTGFGDKKLNVVKEVKNITGQSLMDAKKLVEGVPATVKEGAAKDEAEAIKEKLEEAGATVELQ